MNRPCLATVYDITWGYDTVEHKDHDTNIFTCTKVDLPSLFLDNKVKPIQVNFKIAANHIQIKLLLPQKYYWQNWVPKPLNNVAVFKHEEFQRNLKENMLKYMLQLEKDLQSSTQYIKAS